MHLLSDYPAWDVERYFGVTKLELGATGSEDLNYMEAQYCDTWLPKNNTPILTSWQRGT